MTRGHARLASRVVRTPDSRCQGWAVCVYSTTVEQIINLHIEWQASYGSPYTNNAAEFVLPTRDGGYTMFADSDEYGAGEGANIALYKLAGDPPR